ncbi:hypothetical protein [Nocardia sp. NPDC051570]|uniref:hypothetical protein n=1 Tax=Nocardia sp. NPDC051570 TaxID=3364324 RepID=UPI0037B08178
MEWELTVFGGEIMRGVTALTPNEDGKINHLVVYHRPMLTGLRLSDRLRTLADSELDDDMFYSDLEQDTATLGFPSSADAMLLQHRIQGPAHAGQRAAAHPLVCRQP